MPDPIIHVEDIGKCYPIRHEAGHPAAYETLRGAVQSRVWQMLRGGRRGREALKEDFWALKGVNFSVSQGEVVGVVGGNGAGKSTLLKILSKITLPTRGQAQIRGRVASLLEVGTGFHPELTGRENIFLNGAILGMTRQHMRSKFDEIVAFSEVEAFLDTPVKRYSSGMQMRLAFAVAAHLEPEVLIIDEVLAVGDAAFQKKCLGRLGELATGERTLLFVSHNLSMLRHLCPRSLLLEHGGLVADGPTGEVIGQYLSRSGSGRDSVAWDEADAPGDETFRLYGAAVSGTRLDASEVFSASDAMAIDLKFALNGSADGLAIGVEISTDSGEMILSSYADDGKMRLVESRGSDLHHVVCQLPAGWLKSGRYFVSIRVALLERKWIIKQDGVLEFECRNDPLDQLVAENPAKRWLRRGIVAPLLNWRRVDSALGGI